MSDAVVFLSHVGGLRSIATFLAVAAILGALCAVGYMVGKRPRK